MTPPSLRSFKPRPGYWCECVSVTEPEVNAAPFRAYFDAEDAAQAVRWIRVTLRTIVAALEGEPLERTWQWITHGYRAALDELQTGGSYAFTLHAQAAELTWTARPVLFLPLVHRQAGALPPCTEWFSTAQLPALGRE